VRYSPESCVFCPSSLHAAHQALPSSMAHARSGPSWCPVPAPLSGGRELVCRRLLHSPAAVRASRPRRRWLLATITALGCASAVAFSASYQMVARFANKNVISLGLGCVGSGLVVLALELALGALPGGVRRRNVWLLELTAGAPSGPLAQRRCAGPLSRVAACWALTRVRLAPGLGSPSWRAAAEPVPCVCTLCRHSSCDRALRQPSQEPLGQPSQEPRARRRVPGGPGGVGVAAVRPLARDRGLGAGAGARRTGRAAAQAGTRAPARACMPRSEPCPPARWRSAATPLSSAAPPLSRVPRTPSHLLHRMER